MAIIDNIRIRQTFDPEGKNGGYKFESGLDRMSDKVEESVQVEDFVIHQLCHIALGETWTWKYK